MDNLGNGIEVLSQNAKYSTGLDYFIGAIVCGLIASIVLYLLVLTIKEKDIVPTLILIFLLFIFGGCSVWYVYDIANTTLYFEYKVTLSSEIKYNDFISKFNILNSEGKILTVTKKDN